jgi:hypothetical protein
VQALEDCPPEKQGPVWERTFHKAGGKKITKNMVIQAAREEGVNIAEPGPSASTLLGEARNCWRLLRPLFIPMVKDDLLLPFGTVDRILCKTSSRDKNNSTAHRLPVKPKETTVPATETSTKLMSQDAAPVNASPAATEATQPPPANTEGTSTQETVDDLAAADAKSETEKITTTEDQPENPATGVGTQSAAAIPPAPTVSGQPPAATIETKPMPEVAVAAMAQTVHSAAPEFILDCSNGGFENMLTSQRPWVTAFAGTVLIGFESREQFGNLVRAGFPHPKPVYGWKADKFNGVWEHTQMLPEDQLLTEVQRIQKLLVAAHAKGAPLKELQRAKSA